MSDSDDYKNLLRRNIGIVGRYDEDGGFYKFARISFGWHYGFYLLEDVKEDYVVLRWDRIVKEEIPISRFTLHTGGSSSPPTDWMDLVSYHLGTKRRTKGGGWAQKDSDIKSAEIIYRAMNRDCSDDDLHAALATMSAEVTEQQKQNKSGGCLIMLLPLSLGVIYTHGCPVN